MTGADQFLILNVGRLVTEKGQTYLIQALNEVRRRGFGVKVAFCGPGPLEADLKAEAKRLDLEEHVIFPR